MKNIQKTNEIRYCLGGEIQNLGGEISPPKGPEKNTGYDSCKLLLRNDCGHLLSPLPRFYHLPV